MSEKDKPFKPPRLTPEQIREALRRGAESAKELDEQIRSTFEPTTEQMNRRLR